MFSILHVTDLHRAKSDPISNSELLSALISDRERYELENPAIRPPDAIVVSGDLIQGVGLDVPDFEAALSAQYAVAHDFLSELTERFLSGDRSRIVIIPGNHDIDWNMAFNSMEVVSDDKMPKNMPGALYEPGSPYRWDWKSRRLYHIKDQACYNRRLAAFWNFFEKFYAGVEGMLRVESWSDANLYSLDNGNIGVAAFNSCSGNDCFAFHGEIRREVVAQSYLDLKDLGLWRLRIAVWHHDVEGPPHRADYMDADIVRGMIGRGFRLGLYGHQHRLQITPQHAHLLDQETMVLASSGSLCAGRWDLPTGALRGYSIVEINDDYTGARVHVREMRFANLFSRAALRDFEGRSYVDLEWTTPLDAAGRLEDPVNEERTKVLRNAEDALRGRNDPQDALKLLSKIDLENDEFGRRLLVEAARSTGNPLDLPQALGEPQSIEELVLLVDAYLATRQRELAMSTLADHASRLALPQPLRSDLETKIKLTHWNAS
jgi:Calcineurin-like phosphoesterase